MQCRRSFSLSTMLFHLLVPRPIFEQRDDPQYSDPQAMLLLYRAMLLMEQAEKFPQTRETCYSWLHKACAWAKRHEQKLVLDTLENYTQRLVC